MFTTRHCVILVRHGRTVLNAQDRLRGHLDPPLDSVGHAEATALAMALERIRPQRVICSPLQRAMQTAEPVANRAGVPVLIDPRLVDRDYGQWAGHLQSHVISMFGTLDKAPGVESADHIRQRARAVLDEQSPLGAYGPVVLVTHDVVIRILLADLDPRLGGRDNIRHRTGSWSILLPDGHGWIVDSTDGRVDPLDLQAAE